MTTVSSSFPPPRKSSAAVSADFSVLSRLGEGLEGALGIHDGGKDHLASSPVSAGGSIWGSPLSSHWAAPDQPGVQVDKTSEEIAALVATDSNQTNSPAAPTGPTADVLREWHPVSPLEVALAFMVVTVLMIGAAALYFEISTERDANVAAEAAQANLDKVSAVLPALVARQARLALADRTELGSVNLVTESYSEPPTLGTHGQSTAVPVSLSIDPSLPIDPSSPPVLFVSSGGNPIVRNSDGSYTVEVDVAYPNVSVLPVLPSSRDQEVTPPDSRWFADASHYASGAKILAEKTDKSLGLALNVPASCTFSGGVSIQNAGTNPRNMAQSFPHLALTLTYGKSCLLD